MSVDNENGRQEAEQGLIDWIEAHTGGRVRSSVRQGRWRPAWFIDVEVSDGVLPLYARGDRPADTLPVYPLEYEIKVHNLLESEGVPVPHVLGCCPNPRYIVMQRVGGRANLGTAADATERAAVLREYIEVLARIHRIPLDALRSAGFDIPVGREAVAMDNFKQIERIYARDKLRPDPLSEFGRRWLYRNLPVADRSPAFTVYDSGQFHFDNGHLVAVLDLELAHVGDPMADLAALTMRDTVEPLGPLQPAFEHYARLTGEVIDPEILEFHIIKWSMVTPLVMQKPFVYPDPETDLITYLTWYADNARWAIEGMARIEGVELETVAVPPSSPGPRRAAFDLLKSLIEQDQRDTEFSSYQLRKQKRLLRHLRRSDEIGAQFMHDDIADVERLTGARYATLQEADVALEHLVLEAPPSRNADLIQLFNRRLQRFHALLGDPGSRIVEHPPLQKIGRVAPGQGLTTHRGATR